MSDDYPDDNRKGDGPEPPHAVDAERSIIGAVILGRGAEIYQDGVDAAVITPLKHTDFFDKRHQWIWAAIKNMWGDNRHVDPITLARFLRDFGSDDKKGGGGLKQCGGPEYIAALAEIGGADVNLYAYCKIISDTANQRQLLEILQRGHQAAFRPGKSSPKELIAAVSGELQKLEDNLYGEQEKKSLGDSANAHLQVLANAVQTSDFSALDGEPTNLAPLDELVSGGFRAGKLVILGAQTGMGKTALALDISSRMVVRGRPVVFISLEMDYSELRDRLMARQSQVDLLKILRGREGFGGPLRGRPLDSTDLTRLAEGVAQLKDFPLLIQDKSVDNLEALPPPSAPEFAAPCPNTKRNPDSSSWTTSNLSAPPNLGTARHPRRGSRRRLRALKTLARETGLPILALAQLNRQAGNRENPRPKLSDLRDSGAIEQDADLVLFLYEEEAPPKGSEFVKVVPRKIYCAKNRSGVSGGERDLDFHRGHMLFGQFGTLSAESA